MLVALMACFIVFALFCTGRVLRPLMLPFIVLGTLGYVLYLTGVFGAAQVEKKSPHQAAQAETVP
jgi:hypothetical protein